MTTQVSRDRGERDPNLDRADLSAWISAASSMPLVLGFGNVLLGDDGAGVRMVELLRTDASLTGCEFVDGGTISFNLLSYIGSTTCMLVIDAAELNQPPGTFALFEDATMDAFLKCARRRTVHEVGLIDLLDMARMEDSLPQRRALLCIQPAHIGWSEELSPVVSRAMHEAADHARRVIRLWTEQ